MIDKDGYRANVGIVLLNHKKQVLLAKRTNTNSWQLPQGGIKFMESDAEALYRELYEEVGLTENDIKLLAKTPKWLRYSVPKDKLNGNSKFIGQKQIWFLLEKICADATIKLDNYDNKEFDDWCWVDYWQPINQVIDFKKNIYEDMLKSLAPIAFANNHNIPKYLTRKFTHSAICL